MDETASEEELVHKQEGDESQDYFVRSGTGTDKKLMRSVIGSRHKLTLKGGGALKMMKWRMIHQMKQQKEI